jgi:zinc transport system permease protein
MFDDFMTRAIAAGIGVALIAGPMGCFVIWRRLAYFGDTMAHSGLLGIAVGLLLGVAPVLGVVAVTLLTALTLAALDDARRLSSDTLLGILSHGTLAAGLVAVSLLSWVRVDLMGYLFGDLLAVSRGDLLGIYLAGAVGLGILMGIWRPLLAATVHADLAAAEGVAVAPVRLAFTLLVAVVIALAMKVVGILLITSLLIVPAAAARRLARTPEQMALLAAAIGAAAVVLGLQASLRWDLPSGPAVVLAALALFLVAPLGKLLAAPLGRH